MIEKFAAFARPGSSAHGPMIQAAYVVAWAAVVVG